MEDITSQEHKEITKEISKNAQKKLQKQQAKEKFKQERIKSTQIQINDQQESWNKEINEDSLKENYGDYELIQSQEKTDRKWIKIQDIDDGFLGQTVLIRSRIRKSRIIGQLGFLILRQQFSKIQAIVQKDDTNISKTMLKWIEKIPIESIVDIYGTINKIEQEIKGISCKFELQVKKIYVVSRSSPNLPFQLEDAERKNVEDFEESKENSLHYPTISLSTRLQNRVIDLRTSSKQAIFIMQSGVCQLFREYLYSKDFVEIHTPKITNSTINYVQYNFSLKYFEKDAFLVQSPQIYKQMCVQSDFERVFEIGPVFKADNAMTHRHLCEFTSLDLEMSIKENYNELIDLIELRYKKQIEIIRQQYPFEPIKVRTPIIKLTFDECCLLLKEAGVQVDMQYSFDYMSQRQLGKIVLEKYDTDFYVVHKYPISSSPFYDMVCQDNPRYTLSFNFYVRGEEISSGSQRNHDIEYLTNCAIRSGVNIGQIQNYIESLAFGAYPHGGCGVGLERFILYYCNLLNIRNCCLFPRDPHRIVP